jgi:glycosyltransferase involved in cell wall biosynthesis
MSASTPPFVSVLMPLRNEAAFLSRSLGSVLAQDYPADRFEVIVADGMSDDGTRAAIESLRARHPNLALIDNPGRIVATGLNAAIRRARGRVHRARRRAHRDRARLRPPLRRGAAADGSGQRRRAA